MCWLSRRCKRSAALGFATGLGEDMDMQPFLLARRRKSKNAHITDEQPFFLSATAGTISAMTKIRHSECVFELTTETVLEGLLREGVQVPNSCRSGVCQSCLLRATEGTPPASAQQGLKDSWRARGYFLSCVARPTEDLTVTMSDSDALLVSGQLVAKTWLSQTVRELRIRPESAFPYQPGQYVNLVADGSLVRSYSLASVPQLDSELILHVRILPSGRMSSWIESAQVGTTLQLRGPAGECFYVPGRPTQSLLLCGVGTGLAPLYGLLRDALRQQHSGPIAIVHGARSPSGLYLRRELTELAAQHANLTYLPVVLNLDPMDEKEETATDAAQNVTAPLVSPIDEVIRTRFPKLGGQRVFLCGDAPLVTALRKQVFLQGCSRREILADPFLMAHPTSPT